MQTSNSRAKPDVFDPAAPFVRLEGDIGAVQKGVMYGPDGFPMSSTTVCVNRADPVKYLVGTRAYGASGKYLGVVDPDNGNELIPGRTEPMSLFEVAAEKTVDESEEDESEEELDDEDESEEELDDEDESEEELDDEDDEFLD